MFKASIRKAASITLWWGLNALMVFLGVRWALSLGDDTQPPPAGPSGATSPDPFGFWAQWPTFFAAMAATFLLILVLHMAWRHAVLRIPGAREANEGVRQSIAWTGRQLLRPRTWALWLIPPAIFVSLYKIVVGPNSIGSAHATLAVLVLWPTGEAIRMLISRPRWMADAPLPDMLHADQRRWPDRSAAVVAVAAALLITLANTLLEEALSSVPPLLGLFTELLLIPVTTALNLIIAVVLVWSNQVQGRPWRLVAKQAWRPRLLGWACVMNLRVLGIALIWLFPFFLANAALAIYVSPAFYEYSDVMAFERPWWYTSWRTCTEWFAEYWYVAAFLLMTVPVPYYLILARCAVLMDPFGLEPTPAERLTPQPDS